MKHPFCLGIAMLFVAITSLSAQLGEQSIQYFPYGHLSHAAPTSDGYMLAFNPIPNGGTVFIQKIDQKGEEVWHYKLNQADWFNYIIMDMLVLENDECIVSVHLVCGVFCPDFGDINIHLSADGQVLSSKYIPAFGPTPSGLVQTLSDDEVNPYLVYSTTRPPFNLGGGSIYLLDTSCMPLPLSTYNHPNYSLPDFFHKDVSGRFLVPVPQGIGIFDPVSFTISDSLYLGSSHVQAVINAPDSTLLVVHHESIVLINLDGDVLDTRHYPGSKLWKAQYVGGNLYLFDQKNTSNELLWMLNKETMEVIDVLSSFTDGTSFAGVLPGDGEHYVWGNERHNAFIKPITFLGEFEPITTDVALVDFQWDDIMVTTHEPGTNAIQVKFNHIKVHIINTGQDTIHEVTINFPVDLNTNLMTNLFNPVPLPKLQVNVTDIQLIPGQGAWLDADDLIFIGEDMPVGSQLSFEFCVELSCPNALIDASDTNDKLCKNYVHQRTSQEAFEKVTTITAWPNPFANRLYVEGLPQSQYSISLVNVLGQEQAFNQGEHGSALILDLPVGLSGFYTLIVKDREGQPNTTIPLFRSE